MLIGAKAQFKCTVTDDEDEHDCSGNWACAGFVRGKCIAAVLVTGMYYVPVSWAMVGEDFA